MIISFSFFANKLHRFSSFLVAFFVFFTIQSTLAQTIKTVGTGGDYTTLKAAFDAINAGGITGAIELQVIGNTTETATAVLNASGSGSASYTGVAIYPTSPNLLIQGNRYDDLIRFNGVSNVTIDGRVNATGTMRSLTIKNTSTSNTSGWAATIRFVNGASNNKIQYCVLTSSVKNTDSGAIVFGTSTTIGNSNNIIFNNSLTASSNTARPFTLIHSTGSSGIINSNNSIDHNDFYDFFYPDNSISNGIYINSNSSEYTITNNSFYETTNFIPTYAASGYNVININSSVGNHFTISNNFIGGSAPNCGGSTFWIKSGNSYSGFNGIVLNVASAVASEIHGNVISRINWSNDGSTASNWTGINISGGKANIGTQMANIIGDSIGNDAIVFTTKNNGSSLYGIYIASTADVTIENNKLGALKAANIAASPSPYPTHLYGIYKSTTAGNLVVQNNVFGNSETANSFNATSLSTSNIQNVYGIYSSGTGNLVVSNNIFANLTNATTHSNTASGGQIAAIKTTKSTNTIINNRIYNLKISNANNKTGEYASIIGICNQTDSNAGAQTISGNIIYNLSNDFPSFTGNVIGILYNSTATQSNIEKNYIHSLSVDATATNANIIGIYKSYGNVNIINNIVTLGGNTTLNYMT